MTRTGVGSHQIRDGQVKRNDLNVEQPGQAVVRRVLPGSGLKIESYDGADEGTGDVRLGLDRSEVQAIVDFGPPMVPEAQTAEVFVPVPWIDQAIACTVLLVNTVGADRTVFEAYIEEISVRVDDVEPAVGVYVQAVAPNGSFGKFGILITGR